MKKLLSYLIIIFFSSLTFSFSEDISDFEIEGISVDDNWVSALFMTINSKGIEKTTTIIKSDQQTKTESGNIIQIRPTQTDIGDRIKF